MTSTRDRSRESSLDPLSRSYNNASLALGSSPLKRRSTNRDLTMTRPLRESSPNLPRSPSPTKTTQQRTMIFSTPSKALSSHSAAPTSPWRIKVTVEAEPEDGDAQHGSKDGKTAKTKTIMVPLKDGDEHRPVKRRRMSSKGVETVGAATEGEAAEAGQTPKRVAARKGRRSQAGTSEVDQAQVHSESNAGDLAEDEAEAEGNAPAPKGRRRSARKSTGTKGTAAPPAKKRGPGRPRKSNAVQEARQSSKDNTQSEDPAPSSESTATSKQKKATPAKSKNHKSLGSVSVDGSTPVHPEELAPLLHGSNVADYSFEQQLTNSVRSRRISDRMPTPRHPTTNARADATPGSTPGSTPVNDADYYSSGSEHEDEGTMDEDEDGMTAQLDRSLAESEGFSMVSIESLRSQRRQAEREQATAAGPDGDPDRRNLSAEGHGGSNADVSSNRMSEDQARSHSRGRSLNNGTQHTTLAPTPDEARKEPLPGSAISMTSDLREAASESTPFSAFHTGTRRRLRAGLAMGELLAQSEPAIGGVPRGQNTQRAMSASKHLQRTVTDGLNDGRLPTPADTAEDTSSPLPQDEGAQRDGDAAIDHFHDRQKHYDDMSWEPSTFVEMRNGTGRGYDEMSWEPSENLKSRHLAPKGYDDMSWEPTAQPASKASVEREATAGTDESRVSYEDPSAASANDIWLEEAETSFEDSMAERGGRGKRKQPIKEIETQSVPTAKRAAKAMQEQTPDLQELFGEPDRRPTRGRIPRTWRRTSGNHFLYSDENPSPEQKKDGPRTPLFLRDLRELDEQVDEAEEEGEDEQSRPVPSIERSPSPRRGILSSPLRRRESASPAKEVHFGEDTMHEYDEAESSSHVQQISQLDGTVNDGGADDSAEISEADCDVDATMYADHCLNSKSQHIDVDKLDRSRRDDVVPSRRENPNGIGPLARRQNRSQPSDRSSMLQSNSGKQYPKLFDNSPPGSGSTQPRVDKSLPPTPRQPTPRRPILKHRPVPPQAKAPEPTRGIFSMISSWLYPPAPDIPAHSPGSLQSPNQFTRSSATTSTTRSITEKTTTTESPNTAPRPATTTAPKTAPTPKASPTAVTRSPTDGILPGWNRNHYLLLDHHFRHTFPTASSVLEEAVSLHGTTTEPDAQLATMLLFRYTRPQPGGQDGDKDSKDHLNNLALHHAKAKLDAGFETTMSDDMRAELGKLISAPGEKPMEVSLRHCLVADAFMTEAKKKGVPLLTDGGLAAPPSPSYHATRTNALVGGQEGGEDFPRRDKQGRVVRVKEEWTVKDVLIRVYGLWVRDIEAALREVERKKGERLEVAWPVLSPEPVLERVRRVLGGM